MSDNQEPADLSQKAISMARHLDRLPPGEYIVKLYKRPGAWGVSVHGEDYGLAHMIIGKDPVDDDEG